MWPCRGVKLRLTVSLKENFLHMFNKRCHHNSLRFCGATSSSIIKKMLFNFNRLNLHKRNETKRNKYENI